MQTPDLRGRFILGSGVGGKDINNKDLTERVLNTKGGVESHTLTTNEIPSHTHTHIDRMLPQPHANVPSEEPLFSNIGLKIVDSATSTNWGAGFWQGYESASKNIWGKTDNTGSSGNGDAHNNMPPFYVLTYIMKL
jgi:microcystin-dependent protein